MRRHAVHPPLLALLAAISAGLVGACAQQEAPPGGPEDRRPPVVVRTVPGAFDTVTDLDQEIRFDFDERVSERTSGGTLDDAVTISPRPERATVKHGRRTLSIDVEGGLAPGVVYRVTLQPVISDLFGNRMSDPFELVFSTGGDPVATTLAGEAWNRTDGRPLQGALVYATSGDGLVYQSVSEATGIFAFRYLPGGSFTLTAFEDRNRNQEVDSMEVQGTLPVTVAPGDTVLVDIPVLEPDSTAAIVAKVTAIDSVTVAVEFDDYLDPQAPAADVTVAMRRSDGPGPTVTRSFQEPAYAEYVVAVTDSFARLDSIDAAAAADSVRAAAAAADSLAAESSASSVGDTTGVTVDTTTVAADSTPAAVTVARDTTGAPTDTVRIGRPGPGARTGAGAPRPGGAIQTTRPGRVPPTKLDPLQGTRPGRTADGRRLLPGKRIVLVLSGPLVPETGYEVEVGGVVNINGLGGGGGLDTLVWVLPVDTIAADSIGADSIGAGDTAGPGDTVAVPDTGGVLAPAGPNGMTGSILGRSRR